MRKILFFDILDVILPGSEADRFGVFGNVRSVLAVDPFLQGLGVISRDCHRRNALVILSQNRPFCHLPCRFVHFSGIGPGFAFPLCGSDKELRE